MSDKKIYKAIGRHLVNTPSKKNKVKLKGWMGESDENKSIYENIERHWRAGNLEKTTIIKHDEIKKEIWKKANADNTIIQKLKRPYQTNSFMKYAAVVLLVVCSGLVFYFQSRDKAPATVENQLITKSNTAGRKSEIHLKDGTIINLNAESELSYHEVFSDTARMVWLEGEAFFDVAKDTSRPFYVISRDIIVQALGTSFNVSGYPEQGKFRVSLATGKVKVGEKSGSWLDKTAPQITLEPGQEVYYQSEEKAFSTVQEFDANQVQGWIEGVLHFNKASLEDIIRKLERWYGVDIELVTPPERALNYTGQFKRQNLENVLTSMAFVNNFEFEINNKNVVLNFKNDAYE